MHNINATLDHLSCDHFQATASAHSSGELTRATLVFATSPVVAWRPRFGRGVCIPLARRSATRKGHCNSQRPQRNCKFKGRPLQGRTPLHLQRLAVNHNFKLVLRFIALQGVPHGDAISSHFGFTKELHLAQQLQGITPALATAQARLGPKSAMAASRPRSADFPNSSKG